MDNRLYPIISFLRFPLIVGVVFIHVPYEQMFCGDLGWGG